MKNKIYATIVISFVIFLISMIFKTYYGKYEIDNYGKIIIGKYVSHRSYPKTQKNYFVYYINGEQVKNYSTRNISPEFAKNIGKFYKIKYYDKYPEVIHPLFDQEVTDTAAILGAGFHLEDIEVKKKHKYNPLTNTYDLIDSTSSN